MIISKFPLNVDSWAIAQIPTKYTLKWLEFQMCGTKSSKYWESTQYKISYDFNYDNFKFPWVQMTGSIPCSCLNKHLWIKKNLLRNRCVNWRLSLPLIEILGVGQPQLNWESLNQSNQTAWCSFSPKVTFGWWLSFKLSSYHVPCEGNFRYFL